MSLNCRNLEFSYNSRLVLSGVSFQVGEGVLCALLGRNGSGKTTLLSCLNGRLKPSAGEVEIAGLDPAKSSRMAVARQVSLVPQEHTAMFPFRVLDVVVMGRTPFLKVNQMPGPEDYQRAEECLEVLEAGDLAHRNFNRISGGERQMALLARALLQSSGHMLLDEPTNHLDFSRQHRLLMRIRKLCRERGTLVVAAMHDPNLAMLYSDRVVMLDGGRVLAQGPTREVMTEANVGRLYGAPVRRIAGEGGVSMFLPVDGWKESGPGSGRGGPGEGDIHGGI